VLKDDGPVRVVVTGTTAINELIAQSSVAVTEVDLTGEGIEGITVEKKVDGSIEINLKGVDVESLEINSPGVTVITDKNTTIHNLIVNAKAQIKGSGIIKKAIINADDVTFEKAPEKQEVAEGVKPPTVSKPGGGGGSTRVLVTGISVDQELVLETVGNSFTITATVLPSNATNKNVTWESSNDAVATVTDGVVEAVGTGSAIITVTSVADSSKKATVQVVIGDLLVPADGSIQAVINQAEAGDVIAVAPGEYQENLVIDKPLTLLGPNANIAGYSADRVGEAVIKTVAGFDAGNGYGGITVLADGVTIDGFSIVQGVAQAMIHTHNSNALTIRNNRFSSSDGASPRGVDIGYASAVSDDVTIEGNEFCDLNCAIYINQGTNVVVTNNRFNNMVEGAVVLDGTWGNTNNISVIDNEAIDANYLLYFFNIVGAVTFENNMLTNTRLSNWEFYNETSEVFFSTIQDAIDWSVAVDHVATPDSRTHVMRSVALGNDSVYVGYIQDDTPQCRDVHRHGLESPYDLEDARGIGALQPKGLATDDRGYVYVMNRQGGGSYLGEVEIYNEDLSELKATFTLQNYWFGGITAYEENGSYFVYITNESNGKIRRYDVTDPTNPVVDASFGTNGDFTVIGAIKLRGITVDGDGTIFVAGDNNLYRISSDLAAFSSAYVYGPMDVALYEGLAFVTSKDKANSSIKVMDKNDLSCVIEDKVVISTIDGNAYSRGTSEGWSGIDIGDDGRIWLCDELYHYVKNPLSAKDRLLVSTPLPTKLEMD
jgi:PII-like signaling protein